jgi:hypothetical protein
MVAPAPRILRVEPDLAVRENRCAVFTTSGYDAISVSPQLAESTLRAPKFDLIVLSELSGHQENPILNVADGADVRVLDGSIRPTELLSLVAERLQSRNRHA